MKTTGNTILITGAGTGMGLEAAKQFSQRGNTIIMVARDKERLQAEAARLENATTFPCDIADEAQLGRLLHLQRHQSGSALSRSVDAPGAAATPITIKVFELIADGTAG
jgi:short-subunit dehydrogenase involved in D-alanine esterification of teichoic acids